MPVCITGQTYDESTTENFVVQEFEDIADEDEIEILFVDEGSDSFNFTVQFTHSSTSTGSAVGEFCDSYTSIYAGTTCNNCNDDIVTYALYDAAVYNCYHYYLFILFFVLIVFM